MQSLIDRLEDLIRDTADQRSRQQLIDKLDKGFRRQPKPGPSAYDKLREAERHLVTIKRLFQMVQAQRRTGLVR